jgi:hypothetical protein
MNKFLHYLGIGIMTSAMLFSFNLNDANLINEEGPKIEIPENINAIFKKSCFGCHNSESRNTKAKDKFMIDKLNNLKKSKLASKLKKISKVMKEGKMPPEKFAAKYPDRVPSAEDTKILIEWAEKEASSL